MKKIISLFVASFFLMCVFLFSSGFSPWTEATKRRKKVNIQFTGGSLRFSVDGTAKVTCPASETELDEEDFEEDIEEASEVSIDCIQAAIDLASEAGQQNILLELEDDMLSIIIVPWE